MNLPFFGFNNLRKVVTAEDAPAGPRAGQVIDKLLADLPELLMACVVDLQSGRVLASYTTAANLNPNKISLLYAKLLRQTAAALAARRLIGGPLTDITLLLDDQLHAVRPAADGQTYCFLAVHSANASLGIVRELMRRHLSS